MEKNKLVVFEGYEIRRVLQNNTWYYSLIDVFIALTDCVNPREYIKQLRKRKKTLGDIWPQNVSLQRLPTKGAEQNTNCANKEGLLRIIEEIPSKKRIEPFKKWLKEVDK